MTAASPPDLTALAADLRARARVEGFDLVGVTGPASIAPAGARLREWVAAERHGEMAWMADRLDARADPRALWPEVRSIVMLGENYGPAEDPLAPLRRKDRATLSVYAKNRDYHDLAKRRLKRLGRWLVERTGCEIKVFVDTAPVMEKPLAEAAGIGWIGKHTNLVARERGSWLFLGALFTTLELPADTAETDHCGACRRCLDVCPTAAFPAPYQLDARRCLSYLTIEAKGPIPRPFRAAMGNRIYGCDDCLAVCPWNKFAVHAREAGYWARVELAAPRLADLAALDDPAFREVFSGSPIKRIGRDRFLRNVLTALGNSARPSLVETARRALDDASALVRGAAVWALHRLDPAGGRAEAGRSATEPDPQVRAEWSAEASADPRAMSDPTPRSPDAAG